MPETASPQLSDQDAIARGQRVLRAERDALTALVERVGPDFARACDLVQTCKGRVVVTGMGKSGHIGGKIAATLASTGTPSFFVHPGEASHGDLGMITRDDAVIAISYSGETSELITILPLIKRLGVALAAMTGNTRSTLATSADVHLDIAVAHEACPLDLAPTASTTAALAMGDALAIAVLEARGFTREDFARSHPGGTLGKRLLLHVGDLMNRDDALPQVGRDTPLSDALLEMTRKGLGMTTIVDGNHHVLGVFTDGDLRRVLDADIDVRSSPISTVMTCGGHRMHPEQLAAEAVTLMQQHKITSVVVCDERDTLVGVLHMHDLLRAGVV